MSMNSMTKTSVDRSSSALVISSGVGCFCLCHQSVTGARLASVWNEASPKMQSRLMSENSGSNSPAAADPYRITLSRFGPAAWRNRLTNSSILLVGTLLSATMIHRLKTLPAEVRHRSRCFANMGLLRGRNHLPCHRARWAPDHNRLQCDNDGPLPQAGSAHLDLSLYSQCPTS